jgi:F0F1-type ATP synthase gamma subunit
MRVHKKSNGKAKPTLPNTLLPLLAHEVYIHKAIGKGVAAVFFNEFEERQKRAEGGNVEFRFHDVIYFLAVAAASGVVGNLAYNTLKKVLSIIRKPRSEGTNVKFSYVVRRSTYEKLREKKYPNEVASTDSTGIESQIELEYERIVKVGLRWELKKRGRKKISPLAARRD